ncbi:MAG: hypothetical protein V3W34_17275 [Phycisphaerae bacterium]
MKRRKLIRPRDYLKKISPGARRMTRQAVGRVFARLRAQGRVSSSPVSVPPDRETVWVSKHDPAAPLMASAARRAEVPLAELASLAGAPELAQAPYRRLSALGVAVVPVKRDRVRLVGTSPRLAGIGNQAYHGLRRRRLYRRELIEAVRGVESNGRATAVTENRLTGSLEFVQDELGLDLCDLIAHAEILIGP